MSNLHRILLASHASKWITKLIEPANPAISTEERLRTRVLNILMLIAIPVAPLVSFAAGLIDGKTVMENLTYSSFQWMLGFSLGMAGAYGLSLAGWYRAARWAAFASATVIIIVQSIGPTASPVEVFYLLALPLAATIFMSRRDAIVLSLASIVIMFLVVVSNSRIALTSRTSYIIVASVMNVLAIVISIYRDLLEKERTALLVAKEAQVELERERSRLLSEFIQSASHDLSTPLSIINTSVVLVERSRDEQTRLRHVATIKQTAQVLQSILERMFFMVKLESMVDTDRQPLMLSSLLDTLLVSHAERAAQRQIILAGEGIAGLPEISGHPAQMLRALQEVLRNALQHTEPGGRVTVSGEVEAAQVVMTITDTGSGIPAEHIPRVFDRFYRVEQYRPLENGHTGLGLSIAKKVIELHGGTITLDSAIQQGTTVKITLPVTPPV